MFQIRFVAAAAAIAAGLCTAQAWSASVTVTTPFMNLESLNFNSLGFTPGTTFRIGANSVSPNGNATATGPGTTGVGTTTNLLTGQTVSRTINFRPSPNLPNFFSRSLAVDPALLGPWELRFTNGTDSAVANVSLPAGKEVAPFINSVTLSGTTRNPTFSWAPPPGAVVNGYRINIYDKSIINNDPAKGPINGGTVYGTSLPPTQTSFAVEDRFFTVPGYALTPGRNYSIEIGVIQTKDGTSGNLSNSHLAAISRSYADFTPHDGAGPPVNLPVVLENGAFKFDMAVQAGQTYYIDPEVAVGYDYATGAGDPNFRSVVLPTGIGDGLYDIFWLNGLSQWQLLADDISGGQAFDFGPDGLKTFRVLGIETSAALNPLSTTAFITGLTFTGNGTFSGTQTPITLDIGAVPEPPTLALVGLALWWVCGRRRVAAGAVLAH